MAKKTSKTNIWLVIGVIVLIVLLFGWLTMADFSGNTDVNAIQPLALSGLLG